MSSLKTFFAAAATWAAVAAAVWPHTSFSGAGADASMAPIERLSRELSPRVAEVCRADLFQYGRERMRAIISAGYPSSLLFSSRAEDAASRYLSSRCAVGPLLGLTMLVTQGADTVRRANGASPIYATP